MLKVGSMARVRIVAMAMLVAMIGATATGVITPTADAQVANPPSAQVTITPDPLAGGSHFNISLFNANLPPNDDYIEIYVTRNGVEISDDPFNNSVYLRCPLDTDPNNDPAITNSCSFFMAAASEAGTYVLDINISFLGDSLTASAVLANSITKWWNDVTEIFRSASLFTGATDLEIRFNTVPPAISSVAVDVMIDSDFDENPDRIVGSLTCTGGPGVFTCSTAAGALQPLCIQDEIGGRFCDDGSNNTYFFAVNGIVTNYSFSAVHYQLSRYDEGRFFGNQSYNNGELLGDFIDLDTFVYGSTDFCNDVNAPSCFDRAYYRTWLDRFRVEFGNVMVNRGRLDVTTLGQSIEVDVVIPRLPVGTNGLRAALAYAPVSNPAAVMRVDLDCDSTGCEQLTIDDVEAGEYRFALNIYNDHPLIDIVDYNYDEYQWGQDLFATYVSAELVVVGQIVARPGGVGIKEGNEGSRIVQVPVRLSQAATAPVTLDWATLDGAAPSATAGVDFVAASGTLTIPAGETVGYVPIEVLGDIDVEPPLLWGEWGFVAFSNLSGPAELDVSFFGMGVFVILDDDTPGT